MTTTAEMLRTYPADLGEIDRNALVRCIEQGRACTADAPGNPTS